LINQWRAHAPWKLSQEKAAMWIDMINIISFL
jgi:hypothetical protein